MKLSKIWKYLTRPHFVVIQTPSIKFRSGYTNDEKRAILVQHLTQGFEDHSKVSRSVEIHPALQAEQEIKKMEKDGLIDYYFELLLLSRRHSAELQQLNQKYGR